EAPGGVLRRRLCGCGARTCPSLRTPWRWDYCCVVVVVLVVFVWACLLGGLGSNARALISIAVYWPATPWACTAAWSPFLRSESCAGWPLSRILVLEPTAIVRDLPSRLLAFVTERSTSSI